MEKLELPEASESYTTICQLLWLGMWYFTIFISIDMISEYHEESQARSRDLYNIIRNQKLS